MLGGSISVESELDKGSTFTLRLPLSTVADEGGHAAHAEVATAVDIRPNYTKNQRILLVEDSGPAVVQMKDILGEQGYEVSVAHDGKDALRQMEDELPDAIILDLMMPEVDGFQVLQTLRSVERTAHIPVLILTAKHITREELAFLKSNHIFQLIQKGSIGRATLLEAVQKMVKTNGQSLTPVPPLDDQADKPVILIVEDNPDNMTTAIAILGNSYDILQATDGKMGLEKAQQHIPSLILMDISLPVLDGFQLLKMIRSDENLANIPVIALTARAMRGDRDEILAHGFNGYISKPINAQLLEDTVRGVLDAKWNA